MDFIFAFVENYIQVYFLYHIIHRSFYISFSSWIIYFLKMKIKWKCHRKAIFLLTRFFIFIFFPSCARKHEKNDRKKGKQIVSFEFVFFQCMNLWSIIYPLPEVIVPYGFIENHWNLIYGIRIYTMPVLII